MSQFYRNRRRRQSGEPCDCLRPLIRIFGFISAIGKFQFSKHKRKANF